jgi:hypothetical protein
VLTDWEDRHRDGAQESTMRDHGPALNDLRRALGRVLARSLTDEHFAAYKRAKLEYLTDTTRSPSSASSRRASTTPRRAARSWSASTSRSGARYGDSLVFPALRG